MHKMAPKPEVFSHKIDQARKFVLAIALITLLPSMAFAMSPSQVYESVKDSVVVVKVYDRQGKQTGLASGVMLPSGDIITNYHVVKAGVRYTVGRDQRNTRAILKAGDPDKDLCLLAPLSLGAYAHGHLIIAVPARLGKAGELKVGEPVYAVGAPEGLELTLSEGIISQLRGSGPHPIIQTTVAISPGSSGGGLFNAKGELVGITTFYLKEGQNLNFALPVEWIGEVAKEKIQEAPRVEEPTLVGEPEPIAPAPGERPKGYWENRAEALDKAQDWQGSLAWCRRWTQAEPGNPIAWNYLGFAYGNLGRHREAIEAYREAVRLEPDNARAYRSLGKGYLWLGKYKEAAASLKQAIRLNPDSAMAYCDLGSAYSGLSLHKEAVEAYKQAIRLEPDDPVAHVNLGLIYFEDLGDKRSALEEYKILKELDPDSAKFLFNQIYR